MVLIARGIRAIIAGWRRSWGPQTALEPNLRPERYFDALLDHFAATPQRRHRDIGRVASVCDGDQCRSLIGERRIHVVPGTAQVNLCVSMEVGCKKA